QGQTNRRRVPHLAEVPNPHASGLQLESRRSASALRCRPGSGARHAEKTVSCRVNDVIRFGRRFSCPSCGDEVSYARPLCWQGRGAFVVPQKVEGPSSWKAWGAKIP